MRKIGLIDDRKKEREVIVDSFFLNIAHNKLDWEVIDIPPFPKLEDYLYWISENEISIIIVDENLNEQKEDSDGSVDYSGHDIAKFIRTKFKDFPIVTITSFPGDRVDSHAGDFDSIIHRKSFSLHPDQFVKQIIRKGEKYLEKYQKELEKMSRLSKKMVLNGLTEDEHKELIALREKLSISFNISKIDNRALWTLEFEEGLNEFEEILGKLEKKLKGLK